MGSLPRGWCGSTARPPNPAARSTGAKPSRRCFPPSGEPLPEPEAIPLEILYEDEDLLVVNKPAGLVVHPGAGVPSGTLVNAVLHHYPNLRGVGSPERPGIVHRLDRLTSGCTVVAKTARAYRSLTGQIAGHAMQRTYLAWVCGADAVAGGDGQRPHRPVLEGAHAHGRDAARRAAGP